MANVTLWGATYSDVPAVDLPKPGGGLSRFVDAVPTTAIAGDVAEGKKFVDAQGNVITGTSRWNWLGSNPVLIYSNVRSWKFSETDFVGWTPTTTAYTIRTGVQETEFDADAVNHEYIVIWYLLADHVYNSTPSVRITKQVGNIVFFLFRDTPDAAGVESETFNTFASQSPTLNGTILYYNASNVFSKLHASSVGTRINGGSNTITNIRADAPHVRVNQPNIACAASATYMSTAAYEALNAEQSKLWLKCEIYKTDKNTMMSALYRRQADFINNGF